MTCHPSHTMGAGADEVGAEEAYEEMITDDAKVANAVAWHQQIRQMEDLQDQARAALGKAVTRLPQRCMAQYVKQTDGVHDHPQTHSQHDGTHSDCRQCLEARTGSPH